MAVAIGDVEGVDREFGMELRGEPDPAAWLQQLLGMPGRRPPASGLDPLRGPIDLQGSAAPTPAAPPEGIAVNRAPVSNAASTAARSAGSRTVVSASSRRGSRSTRYRGPRSSTMTMTSRPLSAGMV